MRGAPVRDPAARPHSPVRAPVRDPRARRLVITFMLAAAGAALLTAAGFSWWWARFNTAVMRRDAALIGSLMAARPEAAAEIITAFTKEPDAAAEEAGLRAAARYGWDARLPPQANRLLSGPLAEAAALAAALIALSTLAFTLLGLAHLRRVLTDVREVSDAAALMIAEAPSHRLPLGAEGELSMLSHRVNQMAARLVTAMEQVQREKDYMKQFLTDVSHQLKTPLSSVRMFTELLLDGKGVDDASRSDFLAKSLGQIDRMEWLIASLLACARMEAGAVEMRMREEPLERTVQAAVEGLRALWTRAGVVVEVSTPASPILITHDPRWLGEALSNIVKNSIEHTPGGGGVRIELERTALFARVTITDTGEGIEAEDLPRIFDRFFGSAGASPAGGPWAGTGVGLALARAIIERHDGAVSVQSSPGRGTRFTVTLHASGGSHGEEA